MNTTLLPTKRLLSLDIFRGITIVLMILVNSPGTQFPYPLLDHALWNGCTIADLVFPSFLFIVGLTSVISLQRHKTNLRSVYASILQRSLILFAIGLLLNAFPFHFDAASLRFYGVLQRIACCYLVCSVIYLNTSVKSQILIFLSILWGYWLLMTVIPVPNIGSNQLTQSGTWEAYFDQLLCSSQHLYEKVYDPEGFLSTFPAIATTLIGTITGSLLLGKSDKQQKMYVMIAFGWLFLILAWLWNFSFPINKNIWTSSFSLWCGGYALIGFAFVYLLVDIWGYEKWAYPFKVFGMNALFAFIFHVFLLKVQLMFVFTLSNGTQGNLRYYITDYLFSSFSPQNAALLYALAFLCLNYWIVWILYKRSVFIKI
ncbi:MAG: acyltransferase family protein [Legionellales bacterium]